MRALVTGSAGFVGRHFAAELKAQHWEVTEVDIKFRRDARHFFQTCTARFDLVLHCAANVGGREAIDNDPMWIAENYALDADFFRFVHRTRPHRAVYFSSSAAYPTELQMAPAIQLRESMINLKRIRQPDAVYGMVKLSGEMLAARLRETGQHMLVVRPFSGYGTDQEETYPFAAFVGRALRNEDPFQVWGDGKQVRDFIHVDDVVGAVMVALRDGEQGPVNLCTGVGTSMSTLAYLCNAMVGHDYHPTVKHVESAPSGVQYRVGDPTLMHSFYVSKITIAQGVAMALA